jgi:uncharacterized protein
MHQHEKIDYVEFPARDIAATKKFFNQVFQWTFVDYGPKYTAFYNEGIDGGFFLSSLKAESGSGSALIVFYSENLEKTKKKIEDAEGKIVQDIFTFPGGRRFHFTDPNGNEFAIWSDK